MIEHNDFDKQLEKELRDLQEFKQTLKKQLLHMPEGSLNVMVRDGKNPAYYHYYKRKKRIYIPKKEIAVAAKLAQKAYALEALQVIENRLKTGRILLKTYGRSIESIYDDLIPARKQLVQPLIQIDEEYIRQWYGEHPGNMNSYPINSLIYSNRGEQTRSKSEKIAADIFYELGVPYAYEPKLMLSSGRMLFPDFMALNVRKRKTYIYEHFGMMDDSEYAENAIEKIRLYETQGYFPGDNFFFTMETKNRLLDTRLLRQQIKKYLL